MVHHDKERDEQIIRRNAARIALFAYAMTVLIAIGGIWKLVQGDVNSTVSLALSATLFLICAIISTMRTRGY
jgi:hypothetical protein